MTLLTKQLQDQIAHHKEEYEWYDEEMGDMVMDILTVVALIMSKMCPDIKQNVFQQLRRIKDVKPVNFQYNLNQWSSKMESTRADI